MQALALYSILICYNNKCCKSCILILFLFTFQRWHQNPIFITHSTNSGTTSRSRVHPRRYTQGGEPTGVQHPIRCSPPAALNSAKLKAVYSVIKVPHISLWLGIAHERRPFSGSDVCPDDYQDSCFPSAVTGHVFRFRPNTQKCRSWTNSSWVL